MDIKEKIKEIGSICKTYRIEKLELSLTDFANLNNENLQNIHAFEKGRANNIKYVYMYINMGDVEQTKQLLDDLFNSL